MFVIEFDSLKKGGNGKQLVPSRLIVNKARMHEKTIF